MAFSRRCPRSGIGIPSDKVQHRESAVSGPYDFAAKAHWVAFVPCWRSCGVYAAGVLLTRGHNSMAALAAQEIGGSDQRLVFFFREMVAELDFAGAGIADRDSGGWRLGRGGVSIWNTPPWWSNRTFTRSRNPHCPRSPIPCCSSPEVNPT